MGMTFVRMSAMAVATVWMVVAGASQAETRLGVVVHLSGQCSPTLKRAGDWFGADGIVSVGARRLCVDRNRMLATQNSGRIRDLAKSLVVAVAVMILVMRIVMITVAMIMVAIRVSVSIVAA